MKVEEKILLQESRIKWIMEGDENTFVFHASVKQSVATNRIAFPRNEQGEQITEPCLIKAEIVDFYKRALGIASRFIQVVDSGLIRKGPLISSVQAKALLAPVRDDEIDRGLMQIHNLRAQGIDG